MTETVQSILAELEKATQLSDITQGVTKLEALKPFENVITFGCSANITIDQLEVCLKKHAFLHQREAKVVTGAFDSHLENLELFSNEGVQYVLLLNFFDSLVPSLEARATTLNEEFKNNLKQKISSQLQLVIQSSKSFKEVFIPLFHRMSAPASILESDGIQQLIDELNEVLQATLAGQKNFKLIDLNAIIETIGRDAAFNTRFYYKFKAPYSVSFLDELAKNLFILLRGGGAHFYKALVLDCDNTLWGGIIGEDQMSGIKIGPHEYPDNIYWNIQNEILTLKKQGALLVLCSKNNANDVDEVLSSHSGMVLKEKDIILKKVNWFDKATNLREIATELNIGLDSLVFLDDSEFECNSIRTQLPQVKTVQVPKNVFDYPKVFQKIKNLFPPSSDGLSTADKTEQYKIRALALQEEAKFSNQADYLASLKLKVILRKNHAPSVARISELTLKSNQFNVTTRRYSPAEITALFESKEADVYSLEVSDKFGDSGLTGVVIVRYQGKNLQVDSFLMSCRVIGRGVEFSIWEKVFDDARKRGITHVESQYIKTSKNALVESFFDKLGMNILQSDESAKHYRAALDSFAKIKEDHVEVIHDF